MSPEPLAADRTYQALKRDIVAGRHRPGTSFHLQRLADEFGTSITPVRDAIHRMVGERLLDVLPGGGFHLPVPSAEELRDLYGWHEQLIRQALNGKLSGAVFASFGDEVAGDDHLGLVERTSEFFALAAAASRNREIVQAVANASDRLSLARMREPQFIKSMAQELDMLLSAARSGRTPAIRVAVREYHRRRLRRIERIALALRD